jgi:hypothetical protein
MNPRNAREPLAALLRSGFRGTCASAALETGLAKVTVYARLIELQAEGLAQVVGTEPTRNSVVHIWAAAPGVRLSHNTPPAGIVAKALASRHPLHHWAVGSLQA